VFSSLLAPLRSVSRGWWGCYDRAAHHPCEACGGDGYFTEPVSHDSFSGWIKEQLIVCTACAGYGSHEAEVELEDTESIPPA
jgi:hypothetical protein